MVFKYPCGTHKRGHTHQVREYRYFKPSTRGLDIEGLLADLAAAEPGAVVVLHACAHNPTGAYCVGTCVPGPMVFWCLAHPGVWHSIGLADHVINVHLIAACTDAMMLLSLLHCLQAENCRSGGPASAVEQMPDHFTGNH